MEKLKIDGIFKEDFNEWLQHESNNKFSIRNFTNEYDFDKKVDLVLKFLNGNSFDKTIKYKNYIQSEIELNTITNKYVLNELVDLNNERLCSYGFSNNSTNQFLYIFDNILLIPINNGNDGYQLFYKYNYITNILYFHQLCDLVKNHTGNELIIYNDDIKNIPFTLGANMLQRLNTNNLVLKSIINELIPRLKSIFPDNDIFTQIIEDYCWFYKQENKIYVFLINKGNVKELGYFII